MIFRSPRLSEDCLYLNVWAPAGDQQKLPVLVYFYGGGFVAGGSSEARYDGASMARRGIVAVTVNYRLNVFGFFAHPELSGEFAALSPATSDVGPKRRAPPVRQYRGVCETRADVTIGGESAGSISVSAQMVSPLSRDLIAGAIGESGAILRTLPATPLADAEKLGAAFAATLGSGSAPSLAQLRQMPAEKLLAATARPASPHWYPVIDGYFLPKLPLDVYQAGGQAHVPLLAGVNSQEGGYRQLLHEAEPTVKNYQAAVRAQTGDHADELLKFYPASNAEEAMDAAQELASDLFISAGTWKWMDISTRTGNSPTYYYLYAHPRPTRLPGTLNPLADSGKDPKPAPPDRGAVPSSDIEYALGNLDVNNAYAWTPEDHQVSELMQSYFANFIKTGNPNGPGLPDWPKFESGQRLVIDLKPRTEGLAKLKARYDFLDTLPPIHLR